MTLHFEDAHLTVHVGDCREVMAAMPERSVHCVVTSPPYWGLRDYGTASWEGGEEGCDHERARRPIGNSPSAKSTLTTNNGQGPKPGDKFSAGSQSGYASDCPCGARRIDSQLGLEPTPEEYVANMVAVFREVRRVLRDDGTVWLNVGDSYAGGGRGEKPSNVGGHTNQRPESFAMPLAGLKPKDLVGIPWRVAFALQADGWYLRSDIIWAKPNPMPESVTDRPTKAHEYVFLLTKSARYWYDADAVREAPAESVVARTAYMVGGGKYDASRNDSDMGQRKSFADYAATGRNLRTVWTIATQPYPGAHFATFPETLVEPCVKAGTSERGVCPECGAPWTRATNIERSFESGSGRAGHLPTGKNGAQLQGGGATLDVRRGPTLRVETTGWHPTCAHAIEPVPASVLDPFAGSGTTGRVANRLGRRAILVDLSAEYIDQAMARNAQAPLGLGA